MSADRWPSVEPAMRQIIRSGPESKALSQGIAEFPAVGYADVEVRTLAATMVALRERALPSWAAKLARSSIGSHGRLVNLTAMGVQRVRPPGDRTFACERSNSQGGTFLAAPRPWLVTPKRQSRCMPR